MCRTPWTVRLDVLDRECFIRRVKTNPRYPPVDESTVDTAMQATLVDLMRPGTLILQTPARAEQLRNLPNQPPSSSANTLSLFAFMLSTQRAKHWLHGMYLIVSRGSGDGSDGFDSIVATNLTRLATPGDWPPPCMPGTRNRTRHQ